MLASWCGIDSIGIEWRGAWSDPLLHYKGHTFNGNDVQDGLWENYVEDGGNLHNEDEWFNFVTDNAVNYLEDLLFEMGW